ncbi:MAG: histone H1 [Chloroflexi bacterium]|nr:histone H1 [Chloroflexota bacterium]MDA1272164.1 histone H1 [Chloroflexota bacterium]
MPKQKKPPKDVNALAAFITEEATGEPAPDTSKNASAAERGKKGGLKGGKARAAKMTPEERSASARKAAQARWANRP